MKEQQVMMTTLKVEEIHAALEEKRKDLRAQIAEKEAKMLLDVDNPDRSELAQYFTTRQENILFVEKASKQLAEVEAALARIADGSYGLCAACGREISAARLAALPETSMCVQCKAKFENRPY